MIKLSTTIISYRWRWEKHKNQRFEIMVKQMPTHAQSTVGVTLQTNRLRSNLSYIL